jgi:hypothetical protein
VVGAQSAVVRTGTLVNHYVRGVRALAVHPVGTEFLVHFVRAKVKLFALAVRRARLGHKDLAVPFKDFSIQNHVAIWTDALRKSNSPPSAFALAGHIRNLD